jgi:hypothetical protein
MINILDIIQQQKKTGFYMTTDADCSLRNIVRNKIGTMDNVEKIYRFVSTLVSSQKCNMQTDEYSLGISVFSKAYCAVPSKSLNIRVTADVRC